MHTSLILYAEHEFNASTFTARVIAGTGSDLYSCITGAIGALRGPKHGGANEVAFEIQQPLRSPRCRRRRYPRAPRGQAKSSSASAIRSTRPPIRATRSSSAWRGSCPRPRASCRCITVAERIESVMQASKNMFPNLDWYLGRGLSPDGHADRDVHAAVRDCAHHRLGRARDRAARRRQDHPAERQLRRVRTARRSCRSMSAAERRARSRQQRHVAATTDRPQRAAARYGDQRDRRLCARLRAAERAGAARPPSTASWTASAAPFWRCAFPACTQAARPGGARRACCAVAHACPGTGYELDPVTRRLQHRRPDALARLQRHLAGGRVGPPVRQSRRAAGGGRLSVARRAHGRARADQRARAAGSHDQGARDPGRAGAG